MKIIVCGGRKYEDVTRVYDTLDALDHKEKVSLLIHGGAEGADTLAGCWARDRGVPVKVFKANWEQHGRAAGPLRNYTMLEQQPDLVVAFPGGKGTTHMVNLARLKKIPVEQSEAGGLFS